MGLGSACVVVREGGGGVEIFQIDDLAIDKVKISNWAVLDS